MGHTFKTSITTHRSTLPCSRTDLTATTQTNRSTHSWSPEPESSESVPEFRAHHQFFYFFIYFVNLSDLYARVERADGSSASVWRSFLRHSLQPYLDALRCVSTCPTISQKYKPIISNTSLFPHINEYVYISF